MMRKLISLTLIVLAIMSVASCSSDDETKWGDEVWGLRMNQSKSTVAKSLKDRGLKVQSGWFDSYITVKQNVDFMGVKWDEVTCYFSDGKLKEVEFDTYGNRPNSQVADLSKSIAEQGYPPLLQDASCPTLYIGKTSTLTVLLSVNSSGQLALHFSENAPKSKE